MQTTLFSPPSGCCGGLTPSEFLTVADHDMPQIGGMDTTSPSDALLVVEASGNADQITADEEPTINPNITPPSLLNARRSFSDTMVALSPLESLIVNSSNSQDSIYAMDQDIVLPDAYTFSDKVGSPAPQYDKLQTKTSEQTDNGFHVDPRVPSQIIQSSSSQPTRVCLSTSIDLEPRDPLSSSPLSNMEGQAPFSDYAPLPDSSPIPSLAARPMLESPEPPLALKESSQDPRSLSLSHLNSYPLSPSSSMPSSSPAKLFSSSPLPSSQSSDISHSDKIMTNQQIEDNIASPKIHDSFTLHVSPSVPPVPDLSGATVISQKDVSIALAELEKMPSSHTPLLSLPPVSNLLKSLESHTGLDNSADIPLVKGPVAPGPVNHALLPGYSKKRTRSNGESSPQSPIADGKEKEDENVEAPDLKRSRKDTSAPPAPKRSTVASQKIQHKKLSTPFRSPLMKKTTGVPSGVDRLAQPPLGPNLKLVAESSQPKPCPTDPQLPATDTPYTPTETHLTKVRTNRAAKQFKSPLSAESSSAVVSSVRLTPTIQTLERRVQVLKRAVKVKRDGEEKTLEGLVKKWTQAGREVAYEVWGLVKDRGGEDGSADKRGGWGDEKGKDGKKNFEDSWGWNEKSETPVDGREEKEVDEDEKKDTLGTMLKQLGIDPQTLGWDEGEGTFEGE